MDDGGPAGVAWLAWTGGTLAWLAAWVVLGARFTATRDGDALVTAAGRLLPGFAAATCLAAFALAPAPAPASRALALWAHHASVSALFLFLLAAQYFQTEAWWRARRGGSPEAVAGVYRRLWVLTELVPAPVAVVVLLTGLRLIWEAPETNTPTRPWLLALVSGFSLFFWDGLLGYRPTVRRLRAQWDAAARREVAARAAGRPPRAGALQLQLLAHVVSFAALFLVGALRHHVPELPATSVARLAGLLDVLPSAWAGVAAATLVWGATGVLVLVARAAGATTGSGRGRW